VVMTGTTLSHQIYFRSETLASVSMMDVWERLIRYKRTTLVEMNDRLVNLHGHSLDDFDVLHQLSTSREALRMGDLADRLLVANSSCHRIVTRLVSDGLVTSSPSPQDRRVRLVVLTPSGRSTYRRLARTHRGDINRLFLGRLDPTQQQQLASILDTLEADV